MSDAVLKRMITSFMHLPLSNHAFGWQGGEPTLMGLDFFKRVIELQQQLGRKGSLVSNGLQTNGTLLNDDWAKHLARYKFLVGVSLDGPKDIHDLNRTYGNQQGSHADVLRGIAALQRHEVSFNILTLVNRANVDRAREVYRYHCEQGFLFQQYIECVEYDGKGQRLPYSITAEEWGNFLCELFDEWRKHDTRRVSIRLFDSILVKLVEGVGNVCQMGEDCRQYLVVEHNGDIYPCDFFVEEDLLLGNLMQHQWQEILAAERYRIFGARKRLLPPDCEGCPYRHVCAGDCPKNRLPGLTSAPRLSGLCAGWKQFYAHALPHFERLAAEIRAERQQSRVRPPPAQAQGIPPGRNDPCPCGSGRKYKKCCLR